MKLFLCALFCICVVEIAFVESGVILDKIKTGASNFGNTVKCGLHKVGDVFVHHEHASDPCQQTKDIENNKIDDEESTQFAIDIRGQETRPTENPSSSTRVVHPNGRRIIFAGSNCPPGQRADIRGTCREEY